MNLSGKLHLTEIVQCPIPDVQYFKSANDKHQIILHHSAGWDNARGMFAGWAADKQRVATCAGITDDGTIYQCFGSEYWAWHINVISKGNAIKNKSPFRQYMTYEHAEQLERESVAVEICNWGPLLFDGNATFKTWAGTKIKDEKRVIEYTSKFRNAAYYERYTDKEIEALWKLIRYWAERYDIPTTYRPEMWDVSPNAVAGLPGVWTHVSFRSDKSDMHPQPELIEMLKSL